MAEKPESSEVETSGTSKDYDFDEITREVGGFGRYIVLLYAFMYFLSIPTGAQNLVQVFYGATPKFECAKPLGFAANDSCMAEGCCANCSLYQYSSTFKSAVTEWNLVCDRAHLKALTQAMYMAGLLVGSVTFSVISDRFGRKIGVFISIALLSVCGCTSGFADCLSLFILLRFLTGMGNAGCLLVRYVYCMELITIKHRTAIGFMTNIFISIGFDSLALLAYLIRDYHYLLLAVSLPVAPLVLFWGLIPETPRWLVAQNRIDEAHALLMKFAAHNGVQADPAHLRHVIQEVKKAEMRKDDSRTFGFLDLLRTRKLRKRTFIMGFNWFVNAIVFFGLNLNVKNLGGDMYLNFFIMSIIEIPGALLCWFLIGRFGRRIPYVAFEIIGGLACMLVLAFPSNNVAAITTLAMIGKVCVSNNFLASYVFTVELYPTVIRNIGLGIASMMARAGGIIAPYFVLLAELPNVDKTLPLVIFGVLGVSAGIAALFLPETLNTPMPQTVEQVEDWDEDYKIYCCKAPWDRKDRAEVEVPLRSDGAKNSV